MAARFDRQQPSYQRQQSYESGGEQRAGGGGDRAGQSVLRRQTVRGAVRGTVRDAGSSAPPIDRRATMLPPPGAGGGVQRGLTRGKTLTRPDRFVAPAPLINPHGAKGASYSAADSTTDRGWDWWGWCVAVITWWGPKWLLNACGLPEGKHRAWKEKCALCSIALFMMGIVGFLTIGEAFLSMNRGGLRAD